MKLVTAYILLILKGAFLVKKKYYDPEFELVKFSFESIMEDGVLVSGNIKDPESSAGDGDDTGEEIG